MKKSILIGIGLAIGAALSLYFLLIPNPTQQYVVEAQVKSINMVDGVIFAHHEEIPNYMEAMTMPFVVKNKSELKGLEGGDAIRFTLHVDEKAGDSWIEGISRIPIKDLQLPVMANPKPSPNSISVLDANDTIPDVALVNQSNEKISLSGFRGKNLLITFIFTRCPLPNLCPRVSKQMKEVQSLMNPEDNLQLLSISFDPLHDTPDVLKRYAEKFGADLQKWQFATGKLAEIKPVYEQFGVTAIESPEILIQHTLVTALVSKDGKLLRRWASNDWKATKVLEELRLNP